MLGKGRHFILGGQGLEDEKRDEEEKRKREREGLRKSPCV